MLLQYVHKYAVGYENDLYMALKKLPTSVRKNRFVVLLDMFLGGVKACDYFTPT